MGPLSIMEKTGRVKYALKKGPEYLKKRRCLKYTAAEKKERRSGRRIF